MGKEGKTVEKFIVYNEDWTTSHNCETLREAEAYRYQEYGYAGYILEVDENGKEVANHS